MAVSGKAVLFLAFGGAAIAFAMTRSKAAAAAPAQPEPSAPPPPQLPPDAPYASPAYPAPVYEPPRRAPTTQEGQPLPFDAADHPLASRYTDDGAPPAPDSNFFAAPAPVPPPATPATPLPGIMPPAASSSALSSLPMQPITFTEDNKPPVAKPGVKRPFGDQPLDVQASSSNFAAAPAPHASPKRSAQQAASDLLAHATQLLNAKRGAELGVKGAPSAFVKAAQIDMGVQADGIYGPATRTKGKQLTGKNFPAR